MVETITLITNVGNSELITADGKPFFGNHRETNVYEESKKMFEKKNLDFNLSTISFVINKIIETGELKKAYLIATNQRGKKNIKRQDTEFIARLIKEKLKKMYHGFTTKIIIIRDNPSNFDLMFKEYEKILKEQIKSKTDRYAVILTGGTQACNTALLIKSLSKFRNKTDFYYKSIYKNEVDYLNIGYSLNKEFALKEFKVLKEKYLLSAAAEIGRKYDIINEIEYKKMIAQFYKNNFNFDEANKIFEELKNINLRDRNSFLREYNNLEILDKENIDSSLLKIRLLFENLKIQYIQENYADALARFCRIEEAIYYLILEKEYGLNAEKKENHEKIFEIVLKKHPSIAKQKIGNKLIGTKITSFSAPLMNLIISKEDKYKEIVSFFNALNGYGLKSEKNDNEELSKNLLREKRNKSIIAHGFEGVSKEDLPEGVISKLGKLIIHLEKTFRKK